MTEDGTRLSGALVKVENDELWLSVLGVKEFLRLPVAGLRSLVTIRNDHPRTVRVEKAPVLELAGLRLPGGLLDGRSEAEASCVVWQPRGAPRRAISGPESRERSSSASRPRAPRQQRSLPTHANQNWRRRCRPRRVHGPRCRPSGLSFSSPTAASWCRCSPCRRRRRLLRRSPRYTCGPATSSRLR